ncbi:hypothetical protein O185_20960 [Photorhabdus temperata J3]|uniref:Uncharacterized protein n=1 Tax=Photorhabdus temperata J3 TaxID=1389415 RepID=U7QV52_PHOTE|nr:hypothetical protein O185_20960 [Photorhabdus temperata J3]
MIVGARTVTPVCLNAAGNCLAMYGYDYLDYTRNAVYVYTRTNGTWDISNRVRFSDPENGESRLNWILSLNAEGDRLAVGVDYDEPLRGRFICMRAQMGSGIQEIPLSFRLLQVA